MHVVIIGAGVIGASLAYALSRHGASITVIDAGAPASGATAASFGWINASFYADAAHFALRAEGIEAYRRLCHDLDVPVVWSGALCWEEEGGALDAQAAELAALGYGVDILDAAAFSSREPHVAAPKSALWFEAEAAAEPAALTRRLLAASGARVLSGCAVEGIRLSRGRASGVRIPGGVVEADCVVVAAGNGSPEVLAPLGVDLPMLNRPGVVFRTQSLPPMLSHVCVAPIGEFRQLPNGQIIMPTAVAHQADHSEALDASPAALADAACARLAALMPGVEMRVQEVALAQRPVPEDGLPVVGACGPEGLYTAVMHSGITLAPIVSEVLAAEIMGKASNAHTALVAPYRPARFQSG